MGDFVANREDNPRLWTTGIVQNLTTTVLRRDQYGIPIISLPPGDIHRFDR